MIHYSDEITDEQISKFLAHVDRGTARMIQKFGEYEKGQHKIKEESNIFKIKLDK